MQSSLKLVLTLTVLTFASVCAMPIQYTIDSKVDHFTADGQSSMFKLRYIVDDQYWKAAANDSTKPRPILFYTGNEGDIWQFYENSGFMTTYLAEKWGALVVFGEHRYFG
jgi:pimeloyl-ACP methyl ester carboxylesterase